MLSIASTLGRAVLASAVIGVGVLTPAIASARDAADTCADGSLDNCYSKAEMREFLDVAVDLVEGYFDGLAAEGLPHPDPAAVVYIPTGRTVATECTDGVLDDTTYAYCPVDDTVFVGQETLWLFYSEFGAAAPVMALAHEYGHALQDVVGVPNNGTMNVTIRQEDQADCIAGAWASHVDDEGNLERVKDLTNIGELLVTIGEMESPSQTHGTAGERVASFTLGFVGGLPACDVFFPAVSLTGQSR